MKLELLEYVCHELPKGFMPYFIYNIIVGEETVGRIVYREGNDEQRYLDGHIGYSIYPEFQGHNYAYKACLLLREIIKVDHVMISCDPDNKASRHIIEKLGAVYIETKVIPKDMKKLFTDSEKEKMIYRWDMNKEGEEE